MSQDMRDNTPKRQVLVGRVDKDGNIEDKFSIFVYITPKILADYEGHNVKVVIRRLD